MKNLKEKLIRLGNTNPELRENLRPILDVITARSKSAVTELTKLRRECKRYGIKVKKKSYSHGPHLTFFIDGWDTSSVIPKPLYEANREAFEALQRIKKKYHGMTLDGSKVYGLK